MWQLNPHCHIRPAKRVPIWRRGFHKGSGELRQKRTVCVSGMQWRRGHLWMGAVCGRDLWRWPFAGEGAFVLSVYPRWALSKPPSYMSSWKNSNKIEQSAAELQQFNLLDLTAIRHIGYSRWAYTDHSTRCGALFSSYTPILVQISWSAPEIFPQNGIRKTDPGGRILLPISRLMPVVFGGLLYVSLCKISAKSDNKRPSYSDFTPSGPFWGPLCANGPQSWWDPSPPGW